MRKPHITRTYGQIHFEDLDPKRFEDLIRELIYDYKDWQNIEATGRGGNDDGFDIRAFEKNTGTIVSENKDEEEIETINTAEGNLWMIQGKREKEIGPKRIKEILVDVYKNHPPYGYILAASANFSKQSYDVFRIELQKKGVMEFHLWGKAELEDMLHQPKNDRILFTYFGFSLTSRRRTRATEIRSAVVNKNKIFRTFGDPLNKGPVLLRDSNDTKYPFKNDYKDFKKNARWKEYPAIEYNPLGLIVNTRRCFAYLDCTKKEFDFAEEASLIYRQCDSKQDKDQQRQLRDNVEDFWEHMPKSKQAYFVVDGLVKFDEMLVIDDKGDNWHKFPHIFIDYNIKSGPFAGFFNYLEFGKNQISIDDYKKIDFFPKSFPKPKLGTLHKDKEMTLEKHFLHRINHGSEDFTTIYETDGRYNFLKIRDAISVPNPDNNTYKNYIEITHKDSVKVKDYLIFNPGKEWAIQEQLGKTPGPEEIINVYEFKRTFDFKYDPKHS
ncbi:MAG: restriction endonuclease [Candidatus Magasanikbacteria bacterium]